MNKLSDSTLKEESITLEQEFNRVDYLSAYLREYNNVNGGLRAFLIFIPFATIPIALPPLFCTFTPCDYNELIHFLGTNIKQGYFLSILESMFLLPLGTFISFTDYFYNYKRSIKIENGIYFEKEALRQLLTISKKCLEQKKWEIEDNSYCDVKDIRDLYYDIGYHYKKYLKYYQKGILRKKLQKKYNEEKILEIEQYFLEKNLTRERVK